MTTLYDDPFALDREAIAALGTEPIPIEPYFSEDYWEAEKATIFRKSWLYTGRVEQIPNNGNFFVKELPWCPTSLLVWRGRDGAVRAFHNMCSHRGNKLVWDDAGSGNSFMCRFHGWTFRPDGSVAHIPEQEMFAALNPDDCGLAEVACDIWKGFIFVNLDPEPAVTLAEYLEPLQSELAGYPFAELTTCYAWRAEVQANWKVGIDAFVEGYHVRFLHRLSAAELFQSSETNPYCDGYGFKLWGPHQRVSFPGTPGRPPKAGEMLAFRFGNPAIVERAQGGGADMPACLNPTGNPSWSFDDYLVFPNLCLLMFNDMYITHEFTPIAADRVIWEARYYIPQAHSAAARFAQEYGACLLRDGILEDGSTLEQSQTMFASGAKSHMILGDQETLLRQFHAVVDDYVTGRRKLGVQ